MSPPLMCARCGREIVPGSQVTFLGMDEPEDDEPRIRLEEDVLIMHAACPETPEGGEHA